MKNYESIKTFESVDDSEENIPDDFKIQNLGF